MFVDRFDSAMHAVGDNRLCHPSHLWIFKLVQSVLPDTRNGFNGVVVPVNRGFALLHHEAPLGVIQGV